MDELRKLLQGKKAPPRSRLLSRKIDDVEEAVRSFVSSTSAQNEKLTASEATFASLLACGALIMPPISAAAPANVPAEAAVSDGDDSGRLSKTAKGGKGAERAPRGREKTPREDSEPSAANRVEGGKAEEGKGSGTGKGRAKGGGKGGKDGGGKGTRGAAAGASGPGGADASAGSGSGAASVATGGDEEVSTSEIAHKGRGSGSGEPGGGSGGKGRRGARRSRGNGVGAEAESETTGIPNTSSA